MYSACGLSGYCFLLFQDELSVQALVEACTIDESKLYWCVSSPTMKDKPVCCLSVRQSFITIKRNTSKLHSFITKFFHIARAFDCILMKNRHGENIFRLC